MTKAQFIIKAKEMFDGQFPNEIRMRVPRFDWMSTEEKNIRNELWEWLRVTIEKYDELVVQNLEPMILENRTKK